jgi:hypothetical protein
MNKIIYTAADSYIQAEMDNANELSSFETAAVSVQPLSDFPVMKVTLYRKPDDIFKAGMWTVVSKKFIELLYSLGASDCIQAFKAEVKSKSGRSYGDFFVLHVIRKVECFDINKSKFKLKQGFYFEVENLQILPEQVGTKDYIFKIDKLVNNPIVLNDSAFQVFQSSDLHGVEYYSFDEWNKSYLSYHKTSR